MYCRCGNQIEGQHKYNDYCKECNVSIIDCLNEFNKVSLTEHQSTPKSKRMPNNEL